MSTKGTAAKSASGAAMSKYDVEVEARLTALESKTPSEEVDTSTLSAKLDEMYNWYQRVKNAI